MAFTKEQEKTIKDLLNKYKSGKTLWSRKDASAMDDVIMNHRSELDKLVPNLKFAENYGYMLAAVRGKNGKKDYSNLSNMKDVWISFFASKNFWVNKEETLQNRENTDRFFTQEKLFDPFFRHGIELASRTKADDTISTEEIRFCRDIDGQMNQEILKNTLTPPTAGEVQNLPQNKRGTEQLAHQNFSANTTLAKSLMLAHMGGLYVVDDKKKEKPKPSRAYKGTMGNLLAHGGRIMFAWDRKDPSAPAADTMANAFLGSPEMRAAFKRSAGTHSIGFKQHVGEADELTEKMGFKNVSFTDNYGMSLATGGFGKQMPGAGTIMNDGVYGHMFVHLMESSEKQDGAMLLGIEGSDPGVTDFTGNKHDWHAKSAKFSSFMADKFGTVGAKVGGRRVDLTMYREKDLVETLDIFGKYYMNLQRDSMYGVPGAREKLDSINEKLSGKHMEVSVMKSLLDEVKTASGKNYNLDPVYAGLESRDSRAAENFSRLDHGFKGDALVNADSMVGRIQASQQKILGKGSPEFHSIQENAEKLQKALREGSQNSKEISEYTQAMHDSAVKYLILKSKEPHLSNKTQERVKIAEDIIRLTGKYKGRVDKTPETKGTGKTKNTAAIKHAPKEIKPQAPGL